MSLAGIAALGGAMTGMGKYAGILEEREAETEKEDAQKAWEVKKLGIVESYRTGALDESRDYDAGLLKDELELEREATKNDNEQKRLDREAQIKAASAKAGNSESTQKMGFYKSQIDSIDEKLARASENFMSEKDVKELKRQRTYLVSEASKLAGIEPYEPPKMVVVPSSIMDNPRESYDFLMSEGVPDALERVQSKFPGFDPTKSGENGIGPGSSAVAQGEGEGGGGGILSETPQDKLAAVNAEISKLQNSRQVNSPSGSGIPARLSKLIAMRKQLEESLNTK